MGGIFDIINVPLGYLFKGIYFIVGNNYGWALVLFTIVTKLILTPLSIKQQKSTMKMQKIQPKLAEIQKKYQYDKDKLNQETLKLYKDNNISPMGGCLPLLIQFPVLIALYSIIRSPLTYIFQLSKPVLDSLVEALNKLGAQVTLSNEIGVAAAMKEYASELTGELANLPVIDFSFFGLDLSAIPSFDKFMTFDIIVLIPILAAITTYLVSKVTQSAAGTQQSEESQAAGTMKMMSYMFPFMTLMFSVSLPAGLGFYWILSNLYQMVQHMILPKLIKLDDVIEEKKLHFRERKNRRKKK